MKLAVLVVVVLASSGCNTASPPSGGDDDGDDGGNNAGSDSGAEPCGPGDPFAMNVLEDGVKYLASDQLGGRLSNTPGDIAARAYITDAFRCAGLVPAMSGDSYEQPFVAPDGTHAVNVVGIVPGSDPTLASEVIILGAHHDHLGTQAGQVYNGANDNASGTIAMIAIARALKSAPPKRTVGFIAFGYEEHDGNCEGSEFYVDHAASQMPMNKVRYMVNLDMVGTYSIATELTVYGASTGSKGRIALDALAPNYAGLRLTHSGNADSDASDFQAFADLGIPYVYFETWDEPCYHKPCDDAERIDYANMARIAKLGRDVVAALANGN